MRAATALCSALALTVTLACASCSVPDSGDMGNVEMAIAALPPLDLSKLRSWSGKQKVVRWLEKQGSDHMGSVWCTSDGDIDLEIEEISVESFVRRFLTSDLTYREAGDWFARSIRDQLEAESDDPNYEADCRFLFQPNFYPDVVAAQVRNKNTVRPDEMERLAAELTFSEIAEELIASPVPPPITGFAAAGPLGRLLPALCGLGADWGCPDSPQYPGGQPDKGGQ